MEPIIGEKRNKSFLINYLRVKGQNFWRYTEGEEWEKPF
jgi:hypothetical protein